MAMTKLRRLELEYTNDILSNWTNLSAGLNRKENN